VVEKLLRERQTSTGTYLLGQVTRSEEAKTEDRAQTLYDEGRHREAITTLRQIRKPGLRIGPIVPDYVHRSCAPAGIPPLVRVCRGGREPFDDRALQEL
jgi:hypothetical protein